MVLCVSLQGGGVLTFTPGAQGPMIGAGPGVGGVGRGGSRHGSVGSGAEVPARSRGGSVAR